MVNKDRVIDEFCRLVAIDSLSKKERKVADFLKDILNGFGLEVKEDKAGEMNDGDCGNIYATWRGNVPGAIPVLFCAHMDTVTPGEGIEPVVEETLIRSAGATVLGGDNKAGIVAVLEAVRVIREQNIDHGDIHICFTIAEEIGLVGAKALDVSPFTGSLGFVLDSSGPAGNIVTQGPAQDKIIFTVQGKAAHAGMAPEEGINAIYIASKAISAIKWGRVDEISTSNVGIISGGKATNIVPEEVTVEAESRSIDEERLKEITGEIIAVFEKAAQEEGGKVEAKVEFLYPALKLSPGDKVVQIATDAARRIGCEPKYEKSGGGCDANILNGKGIPTVNLGIGMDKVHTTDEYITIEDLVRNPEYLVEIVKVAAEVNVV